MQASTESHPERSPDEMVDEVAPDGSVIGLVPRSRMRSEHLRHRSVFVAVVSERGDLLVHKRSEAKDVWPGWWDVAVGGVCAPGEPWDAAARRELAEELGIEGSVVESLGTGAYDDPHVSLVAAVFMCRTEGPFVFADGEITEAHWVPRGEIPHWLASRPFLPDSIALVLPRLYNL